jgi:hypothetical protein
MTVAVPHYPRPAIFSEDSRCIPSGVRSPACLASCQPFLRPTGPSSPRRYASARRRGSARANRPAMRACRASSPAAHARTSSMSAAPRWPPARSLPPGSAGLPAHPSWRAGTLPHPKCGWSTNAAFLNLAVDNGSGWLRGFLPPTRRSRAQPAIGPTTPRSRRGTRGPQARDQPPRPWRLDCPRPDDHPQLGRRADQPDRR